MREQIAFIFSIALRHLLGKKRQTILVVAGVTIGSMVMILTLALGEGIVQDIKDKIIEISPHIVIKGEKINGKEHLLYDSLVDTRKFYGVISRIRPDEKKEIKAYNEILALLDESPNLNGVSPFVTARGVLRFRTLSRQCIIKGIIPSREAKIAGLQKNSTPGSLNELAYTKDGILLGSGLLKKIKASYHDMLTITGENGKQYSVRIVGTFTSGFSAIDDNNGYINLRLGQTITDLSSNSVNGIGLHAADLDLVSGISAQVNQLTGYKTETWEETNENVITLFKRNNNITLFLVLFVFIVAGFSIANVLITIVLQKQQEIAILKSIGVSPRTIQLIFLSEGIILGTIGALLGAIAGHFLTNLISSLPVSYGESATVRGDHIVTIQRAYFFVLTTVFSILISAISAYGPSRRAAKLKPVEILRA